MYFGHFHAHQSEETLSCSTENAQVCFSTLSRIERTSLNDLIMCLMFSASFNIQKIKSTKTESNQPNKGINLMCLLTKF